jgi:RNA polymerase sigma-70 factor (ECF subfamily)
VTDHLQPPSVPPVVSPAMPAARARSVAFERLVERNLDAAYRLARAIIHDDAAAEDVTHDAFEQAWRHWHDLRDPARAEQWLTRILVNKCRDHLRRHSRAQIRDVSHELAASADEFGPADDRQSVRVALAQLSPDHQVIVALRFYRDMTVDDIASYLGIPPNTVRSRIHYAKKRLAELLGDGGDQ